MINEKLRNLVVDTLTTYRLGFLQDYTKQEIDPLNRGEIEDLLEGISYEGHSCYISFLFSKLTDLDKQYISDKMQDIGTWVDFEGLACIYDTDLI